MKNGILFYNNHSGVIPQLIVALYSLRKYYAGRIHIVLGQETPDYFVQMLKSQHDITWHMIEKRHYKKTNGSLRFQEWCQKPYIIKHESPFDNTLYYDCDHLFLNEVDISIFEDIHKYELLTAMDNSQPSRKRKIKRQIHEVTGRSIAHLNRVNGGCVGLSKESILGQVWINFFEVFAKCDQHILRNNPEEFALSLLINTERGIVVRENWSHCQHKEPKPINPEWMAIHYCQGRWRDSVEWHREFKEAASADFLSMGIMK